MAIKQDARSEFKFPSNAAPNKVKDSAEWGMNVANAIEGQWFARESNSSQFYINRNRFHTLRLYAKGDQDIRRYKDEFSINGDLSYLNLDWTPVPIVPKFVDIVVNGMQDRPMAVKAQAVDPSSVADRKDYIENLRAEMEHYDDLMQLQEATGVSVFDNDPDLIPGNEEELRLHLEMDYKQGAEVAIENAINYEMAINEFKQVKYKVNYDLTTIGIGAMKHQFVPGEGIKIEYVDPANLVYSETDSRYYDDCFYFGEIKRTHISDLQVQFPHMTSEQVMLLEKKGVATTDNYNGTTYQKTNDDTGFVDILYFCYKTIHNEIYKMRDTSFGTERAIEKDENFKPPKDSRGNFSKSARSNEVIYEGIKVVGTDILLKWDLQKNMVRPNIQSPKVIMPYICSSPKQYKGKVYSLVKRMEKYADAIQLINLKIQQVVQKMTPSGIFLDVDGLAEIDLGNGSSYNAQTALDMYFQTGSVIGRSLTDEGEFNHGRVPIQELPGSAGQQIQTLLGAYEYNLQQIRNVTGLNEARDGSTPHPDSLVGVQKLAAANSNTATKHILESWEYILKRCSEGLCLRIKDVIEYSPTKDDYINAIGKYNVEILEDLGNLDVKEFGIFIEVGPDEEQKAQLDANIQASIARGELKIEDSADIMRIQNIKVAVAMLKLKRKQREEIEQQMQQRNIQAQNEGLIQVAQQTEQAKAQAEQLTTQSKMQLEQTKSQLDMARMDKEAEKEKELLMLKHQLQMELMGVQGSINERAQAQKGDQDMKKEKAKGTGKDSSISIDSKANTVDGKIASGGLLQG